MEHIVKIGHQYVVIDIDHESGQVTTGMRDGGRWVASPVCARSIRYVVTAAVKYRTIKKLLADHPDHDLNRSPEYDQ